jgi:hypothetical protein
VIRLVEAESCIPGLAGERAVLVLQRGTLDIRLSMPVPPNQQTPHEQDELYVVIRGCGFLVHDDKRDRFDSGDILFVAAGVRGSLRGLQRRSGFVAHNLKTVNQSSTRSQSGGAGCGRRQIKAGAAQAQAA